MNLSLRVRALLFVAAVNVAVFAIGGLLLFRRGSLLYAERDDQVTEQLDYLRAVTLRPQGDINVKRILEWPGWGAWSDAFLVSNEVERYADGRYVARGVALNPVGCVRRGADFDDQAVLASIVQAMELGAPVARVGGGRAVPIQSDGGVWGGLWYRDPGQLGPSTLVSQLLPWFIGSTLLSTAATFFALRRLVLEPVEQLAAGARRVRTGDLSTRLVEPRRSDEISALVRSFNEMTATVQSFNQRLAEEVDRATRQARRAEAAAMTQRRLAAMGELAAGIAHEINNPLGGLQNAVEALADPNIAPERRARYFELLRDGLERIRATVSKLLRFTPRQTEPVPVDLCGVALDALDLVRHEAERRGVALRVRLPGLPPVGARELDAAASRALPPVLGERNELGQVVLNLLVNALDAFDSPAPRESAEPRIDVELVQADGSEPEVGIAVEDNGPGADEETLGRAPDLFFTTKEVGKGTGLGLALVHSVVAAHGGRVLLSSEPGRGFRAELRFPAHRG